MLYFLENLLTVPDEKLLRMTDEDIDKFIDIIISPSPSEMNAGDFELQVKVLDKYLKIRIIKRKSQSIEESIDLEYYLG